MFANSQPSASSNSKRFLSITLFMKSFWKNEHIVILIFDFLCTSCRSEISAKVSTICPQEILFGYQEDPQPWVVICQTIGQGSCSTWRSKFLYNFFKKSKLLWYLKGFPFLNLVWRKCRKMCQMWSLKPQNLTNVLLDCGGSIAL